MSAIFDFFFCFIYLLKKIACLSGLTGVGRYLGREDAMISQVYQRTNQVHYIICSENIKQRGESVT